MISIGIILQKAFHLDIKTMTKLNFYIFSPVLIFKMLFETDLPLNILFKVLLFFCLFFVSLFLLSEIFLRLKGYKGGVKSVMRNSIIFYNSANYALPLNQLVFVKDPFTLSIQIIIMMMQSLLPNTYGVYSVNAHKLKFKESLKTILRLPVIYTIPLAFVLKGFHVSIPQPVYIPINYIADGFIAIALLTLGMQLGNMKWVIRFSDVLFSNFMRLCIGPLLGLLIVILLGIEGTMAQALVLSCSVPTSLSTVLLAVEYDTEPELASQIVFSSTIFSIFTVSLVIYLLQFIH